MKNTIGKKFVSLVTAAAASLSIVATAQASEEYPIYTEGDGNAVLLKLVS